MGVWYRHGGEKLGGGLRRWVWKGGGKGVRGGLCGRVLWEWGVCIFY